MFPLLMIHQASITTAIPIQPSYLTRNGPRRHGDRLRLFDAMTFATPVEGFLLHRRIAAETILCMEAEKYALQIRKCFTNPNMFFESENVLQIRKTFSNPKMFFKSEICFSNPILPLTVGENGNQWRECSCFGH